VACETLLALSREIRFDGVVFVMSGAHGERANPEIPGFGVGRGRVSSGAHFGATSVQRPGSDGTHEITIAQFLGFGAEGAEPGDRMRSAPSRER